MIVLMCAISIAVYLAANDKKAIFPAAAILQWGIFLCSHAMHERYLYPCMLLLMVAYCLYGEKRLLAAFGMATAVTFCNSLVVLLNASNALLGTPAYVVVVSILNIAGFAVCIWACFSAIWPREAKCKQADKPRDGKAEEAGIFRIKPLEDGPNRMHKRDWLIALTITAVYAVVALTNLGSTHVPESVWRTQTAYESAILTLPDDAQVEYL